MNDVGKWLRDADPLSDEDNNLTPADAQALRRTMLSALGVRRPAAAFWPQPWAVAATVALTLASGVVLGRHLPPPRDASGDVRAHGDGAPIAELSQLQFATPGGTRVIWTFNPDFHP